MTKIITSVSKRPVDMVASGKVSAKGSGSIVRSKNVEDGLTEPNWSVNPVTSCWYAPYVIYNHIMRKFIMGDQNQIGRSDDGITWTTFSLVQPNGPHYVHFSSTGQYIARLGAYGDPCKFSTNYGSSFADAVGYTNPSIPYCTSNNDNVIMVVFRTSNTCLISTDYGATFAAGGTLPYTLSNGDVDLKYIDGVFVITDYSQANLAYSYDGSVWYTAPHGTGTSIFSEVFIGPDGEHFLLASPYVFNRIVKVKVINNKPVSISIPVNMKIGDSARPVLKWGKYFAVYGSSPSVQGTSTSKDLISWTSNKNLLPYISNDITMLKAINYTGIYSSPVITTKYKVVTY